jgi:hypothetical protein
MTSKYHENTLYSIRISILQQYLLLNILVSCVILLKV